MGERRGSNPSEMTDDDSISITSTAASVKMDEYVVEGIIAERDDDGIMEYLVRWEGYPDERCTWETRSNFQEDTMLDWETQKMRVSRGYAQPCDVEALLDRVEEWIVSTEQRKSRRRAKRLRLGLPVSPRETSVDEEGSNEEAGESSVEEEYDLESPVEPMPFKSKDASLSDSHKQIGPKRKETSSSRSVAPVVTMTQIWTEGEEGALIDGLSRVKGPYFDQILDLYGPAGTVSQILKRRNILELQDKTRKLYEECQEQGIEKPAYLRDLPQAQHPESNQLHAPGKAPTAVMFLPQKRDSGSGGSKSTSASSNTSPTDQKVLHQDLAAGRPKKSSSAAISSPNRSKVGIGRRGSLSEHHSPETEQASKLSSASSPKHALPTLRRALPAGPASLRKVPKDPYLPHPESPAIENPRRGSLPEPGSKPTGKAAKTRRRSGKSVVEDPGETRQVQMGSSGRGPARLGLSKRKPPTSTSKKVLVSGAAILSNWNKAVKGRQSKAFQPGTSTKPAQKFSTRGKYQKAGKNEPAPNIEKLTFMDLKHGGVAKHPSLATPKVNLPVKTPFQLIQERLKADADASPQIARMDKSSREQNLDNDSRQKVSLYLNIEQTANSEVPGSDPMQNDQTLASPFVAPTNLARKPRKLSLSVNQDHHEQKSTSTQALPSPISTEDVGPSEAVPRSDASVIPRGPRNKGGHSSADGTSSTLAQSRDKSAFAAQPAPWWKGTSLSRPNPRPQTALPVPYGSSAPAQKKLATPAQKKLMQSGTENDVLANILIGLDRQDLGDLRFRGLDWPAKQLLLAIKIPPRQMHISCTHICTIGEYQEFYRGEPNDYIGGGYVVPFWQSSGPVGDMAETLRSQASCAIFHAKKFSLLLYPTDSDLESWDFLNNLQPPVPEGTLLRFVMRKPLPPPDPSEFDITEKEALLAPSESESNISTVFRNILGIEYERLIKQPTPEKTAMSNTFFLFFVGVEKEHSLMCRFLAEHGAKIYNWDDEGAWDYYCNHVEPGVILIEGSFYQLYLIPNLSRLLRKPINVFNITFNADELAPHPHINRLFPHGQVMLITDSFLLFHPHEAARFLRWFRLQVLATKPAGTWKLCARPRIRDFLLSIIDEKSEEDGFVFMQMYESLWYIIPEDQVDDEDLEDDIELDTDLDERPVRCMSSGVSNFDQSVGRNVVNREILNEDKVARNDATLAEWFAGWAMTQLECFRRFHIISGARSGKREAEKTKWEGKWSHIDVLSSQIAFDKYKIPAWEREVEDKTREKEKERSKGAGAGAGAATAGANKESGGEKLSPTG